MTDQPAASTLRHAIRTSLKLARPFFTSAEKRAAWALLGGVVAIELGIVWLLVQFNSWNATFYDALQNRDWDVFIVQLGVFCLIVAVYVPAAVLQIYLNQWLNIRWRGFMTERYLAAWMADGRHYRLAVTGDQADNPDQRIAEDVRLFVQRSLELSVGLLGQVVTFLSFVAILWALSASAPLIIAGTDYSFPGYLVAAALAFAVAGTLITHWIGRPLIGLNFTQQKVEADFRYALVRVRENTEGVALSRGEPHERAALSARFRAVVANWYDLMSRNAKLTGFTATYGQVSSVFSILVLAPAYFANRIQLGALFQTAQAFGQLQSALSYFITSYRSLAEWKAVVDRLAGFEAALADAEGAPAGAVAVEAGDGFEARALAARLPDGTALTAPVTLTLAPAERLGVAGPSGTGKTSLIRLLSGIWPWGEGRVTRPPAGRVMTLPQRPYLPLGTLRTALAYPADSATLGDDEARDILTALGLDHLIARLDEDAPWSRILSGGEQQRVQFARALVAKPDWLLLDEATSALDPASEARLMRLLDERLPRTAVLSIAHRRPEGWREDRTLILAARSA